MSTKNPYQTCWEDIRKAVFTRDEHRCINCYQTLDSADTLDPDHTVSRGVGGSNRLSNIRTLCRQCHNARHEEGLAPGVEIVSSGEMSDEEFAWFKHFLDSMIPAMARTHDVCLDTRFGLENRNKWHLPLGDVRALSKQMNENEELQVYTLEQPLRMTLNGQ